MNFIHYFVSLLSYLICSYCRNNITIVQSQELQQLYFLENERYYLESNKFAIPYKDNEDLLGKLKNSSSLQLLEKQSELNVILDDDAILLQFTYQYGNYIDICYLQNQIIDCILRINNTLYNEGIIISEIKSNQIFIPSKSCYNAFLIQNNSYFIQCQNSINQFQYFILDDQSEILDELIINLNYNCKYDSKFQFNKLIINSINCEISIILIVDIILYIDQSPQFNKNYTKLHEINNFPNEINLIDLKICESNILLLSFINQMCIFNFEDQQFTHLYDSFYQWLPYIQGSCFPFVIRGLFQIKMNIDNLSPIFDMMIYKGSQIKTIQIFDQICLFVFKDQAILLQDYFFEQSIQNVKQIQQLNTLPYLVTLHKNNQITFYKIICFDRFIQYLHLPFFAIFLKRQNKYINDLILFYHQTQQYSINYPLKIPTIDSISIQHNDVINNNIKIDINMLFQYIPFYLDLEINQDNFHIQYKNQTIITHHINLQIKQILKVISQEMNFVVIIYENKNHKIFINIKNNNNEQNILLITKTQELSIEYRIIVSDYMIFLITSESIMKYMIVDKKDLKFVHQIKPKNKIKQYKFDLIKLILLLNDNTIYAYQGDHLYEYYQIKKKEIRDFWTKNQEIYYHDFRVPYLYINHEDSTIQVKSVIPYHNDILITIDGQIIVSHIFVSHLRILIIVKKENQLQLLLYFFDINDIFLLYQMPLFEFQILQPINIKFYGKIFGIITINNEQQYLFIYDVTQQGRSCLRQINQILPNLKSFELIDENGVLIQILIDKIIIYYPTHSINIKCITTSDYAIIKSQIKFKVQSFIQSIPSSLNVFFYGFNDDNNLRYKLDIQQHLLLLNNQNEIKNLDMIFGSINNLRISNICQGSLKEPIQVVSNIQLNRCQYINLQFCLISESILIYDYFGQNRTIKLPDNTKFFNQFFKSNQSILVIYNSIENILIFFDLSKNLQMENDLFSVSYELLDQNQLGYQIISINIINDVLIASSQKSILIYSTDNNIIQCQTQIKNIIQIQFLHQNDNTSYIFLILDANSQFSVTSCLINLNQLYLNTEFKPNFKIVSFYLLNSKFINQEIQITVIMFCPKDKAYIFEFTIDPNSLMIVKQSNNKYLRYPNIYYQQFQKVSDTIYILQGNSQNQISSYYLFKINLSSPSELIDYFYKYEQNYEIQIYNETHFIQIQNDGEQTIIQLIEINNYRLYLENNCDLVLRNDVSILNSTIFVVQDNIKDNSHITQSLVIMNFLLILIIIKKKQKINRYRNTRI
ncbi:unnamed protein product [Paramecium primaurelia]|uniref:Transmembrane protein n=1 Tax=Paramecium primaurelia TaxID=5886 RepID=A0A8S1QEN0_PARPR|nr:unnamed protein product [Paramecium primaurelia]